MRAVPKRLILLGLAAVFAAVTTVLLLGAGQGADAGPLPPRAPSRIVHVCGADLCQVRPDGTARRRLTFDGARAGAYSSPSRSRNGTRMAFVRRHRVWLDGLSPAGARPLPPRPMNGDLAAPRALSVKLRPDGERLAVFERRFLNGDVGSPMGIYVANWGGATVAERFGLSPSAAWGPGDELMDFGYAVKGEDPLPQSTSIICRRNQGDDLKCARILAAGDQQHDLRQPALSPDGRLLAVIRHDGRENGSSDTAIVLFEVATRRPVRTLASGLTYSHPTWSPDGRHVVFTAPRVFSHTADVTVYRGRAIHVVAADGRTAPRLVAAGTSPAWGGLPGIVH